MSRARDRAGEARTAGALPSGKVTLRPSGAHSLAVTFAWGDRSMTREDARSLVLCCDLVGRGLVLETLRAFTPQLSVVDIDGLYALAKAFEEECAFEDSREVHGYGEREWPATKLLQVAS